MPGKCNISNQILNLLEVFFDKLVKGVAVKRLRKIGLRIRDVLRCNKAGVH